MARQPFRITLLGKSKTLHPPAFYSPGMPPEAAATDAVNVRLSMAAKTRSSTPCLWQTLGRRYWHGHAVRAALEAPGDKMFGNLGDEGDSAHRRLADTTTTRVLGKLSQYAAYPASQLSPKSSRRNPTPVPLRPPHPQCRRSPKENRAPAHPLVHPAIHRPHMHHRSH